MGGVALNLERLLAGLGVRLPTSIRVALLLALCLPGTQAQAQTVWNGSVSTDWFTAGNWTAGAPPNAAPPNTNTNAEINTIVPNVTVVNAAGAQANQLTLGNGLAQTGDLTVDGAGRLTLTNSVGFFLVGNFGTGDVTVSDGGILTTFSSAIGNQTGSVGSMTVTGAGSAWNLTPIFAFHVGSSGTGTLDVLDGGHVTATGFALDLGVDNLASGTITVSGTDSQLVSGSIAVGAAAGGTGDVTVSAGGLIKGSNVTIGSFGQGTALITGTGSTLTVANASNIAGALTVGASAAGTLSIEAGAAATSATGAIGVNTGATGGVTVTGAGSQWTMTGALGIGQAANSGTGTLDVLAGGLVDAGSFSGFNSAAVTVDGADSQLNITNGFTLGATGATNTLDVTDGAAFSAGSVTLSTVAASGVAVNVAGTDTLWTSGAVTLGGAGTATMTVDDNATADVTGDLIVDGAATTALTISNGAAVTQDPGVLTNGQFRLGVDGHGTLLIESGGTLELLPHPTFATFTFLARNAGSTADATVTGAGSTWTTNGIFVVGSEGDATLDILAGGTVTGQRSATIGSAGMGTVTVDGAGSNWTLSAPPPLAGISNISVGSGGNGTLNVQNGGVVVAEGLGVGSNPTGVGDLLVTGANSRIDLNVSAFQTFDIGSNGATGTANVANGGVIAVVGQGHLGASAIISGVQTLGDGTLTVDGTDSQVTYTATLDIGEQATGALNVQAGGFVSNTDGYLGSFTNAVGSAGNGTATVTGVGSTWQNAGFLRVGDQGTGELNVLAGGLVTNTSARIANAANSVGAANVDGAGSIWTSTGTLVVGNLGTGILSVTDAGTVNSDAVSINALSTLNIGTGGVAGTLNAPSVASAGLVHFNHTGAHTFAAPITGTGDVTKDAAGITTFTGTSSYSGETTVNGGIFRAGVASAFSSNSAFTVDATLDPNNLNQTIGSLAGSGVVTLGTGTLSTGGNDGSTDFSGAIMGTGGFIKQGTGNQILSGDSTYVGPTTVEAGTLSVNGSIVSAVTVETGARLGGTGTISNDVTALSGGIYAPGNSIGTQTVNGAFTLNSGAVYEVEVNAAGAGDKVIVNGTVNLTGSVLRVLAANGNYKPKTEYLIVDNDGADAVVGKFAKVTTNYAFLTPTVVYDAGNGNDVVLTLLSSIGPGPAPGPSSFCSAAKTRNQCNVALALDQFPTDNALFLAVLNQTAEGARQAFDALSGEIHAAVAGTLADDSRYVREAVLGRLMQANVTGGGNMRVAALAAAGPQVASLDANSMALGYGYDGKSLAEPAREPLAFWTRAYGAWGNFNGDGNAATASRDLGGFISGMDANIGGSWRVGLATGASFSNVEVDARYSSADVETYHLGGYAGGMAGSFALRGGGMWAWSDIDTSRAVVFPGFFERQTASYNADTGQLFGEVAYPMAMDGMALEPFGGLAYVSVDTDSFKEHGGSLASLRGNTDQDVGYSTLGLRAASTIHWGEMLLTPHLSAAWQHAFDEVTPGAALAFATTGIGFNVYGVPLAEDSALIDAGLDFALGPNTTAGVSYSGQFGDGVQDNGVKGRLTWLF